MNINYSTNLSILAKKCVIAEMNLRNALAEYNKVINNVRKPAYIFNLCKNVLQYIFNMLDDVSKCRLRRTSKHFNLKIYSINIYMYHSQYIKNTEYLRELIFVNGFFREVLDIAHLKHLEKLNIGHSDIKIISLPTSLTDLSIPYSRTDYLGYDHLINLKKIHLGIEIKLTSLPKSIEKVIVGTIRFNISQFKSLTYLDILDIENENKNGEN